MQTTSRQFPKPEPSQRFHVNDRMGIEIGTETARWLRYVESRGDGYVFESELEPKYRQIFTHAEIAILEQSIGWRYCPHGDSSEAAILQDRTHSQNQLVSIPENELARVLWRWLWVEKVISSQEAGMSITDDQFRALMNVCVNDVKATLQRELLAKNLDATTAVDKPLPDVRTLWRWLKAYKNGGLQALRSRSHRRDL